MYNYNRILFKDNETPLNAITMNHLEVAIHKLASHSLFPSDLIAGDNIDISSTEDGQVKISQRRKSLLSLNISRIDVVYEIPGDATMGELFILLEEDTNNFKGLYWGQICLLKADNGQLQLNDNSKLNEDEEDGTL